MKISNTATRVLVSVLTIPVILSASYFGGLFFLLFVAFIGCAAFYEFCGMVKNKNAFTGTFIGMLSVLAIIIDAYFKFFDFKTTTILIVVVLFLYELFRNKESAIFNIGSTLIGIFYIGLFSSTIVEIREYFIFDYTSGGYLIISMFASIWVCDSAAFFVGKAFGKHRLFLRVSPKKSWEGAVAGFISSVLMMIAAKYIILKFLSLSDSIIIGIIVGILGQVGDLIESLLKRDCGVKDSSNIIPGHGGVFDRFDSLLYSAPVVYLYLNFINK
jgi:phosphatidate cytidylyltransferase